MKALAKQLPICPRCGSPGTLLDEPGGHTVKDPESKKWVPAQACIKCIDEIRTGGTKRTKKKRAANDTKPRPRKPMVQLDMFSDTTTKGSK